MSTGKPRSGAKERFWRRVLRQWRQSGLSVRAFCAEHELTEANFYAWRRTIEARDGERVAFVPVRVMPPESDGATHESRPTALELVLGSGRVLRIAPGFDAPTLQRLLALLEEGRPC
jgi:hypothetical protein